jgi:hypothetical protein
MMNAGCCGLHASVLKESHTPLYVDVISPVDSRLPKHDVRNCKRDAAMAFTPRKRCGEPAILAIDSAWAQPNGSDATLFD